MQTNRKLFHVTKALKDYLLQNKSGKRRQEKMYDLKDWRGQKIPSTHHSHVIFSETEKPYKATYL